MDSEKELFMRGYEPGRCRTCKQELNDGTDGNRYVQLCDSCFLKLKPAICRMLIGLENLDYSDYAKSEKNAKYKSIQNAYEGGFRNGQFIFKSKFWPIFKVFKDALYDEKHRQWLLKTRKN